MSYSLAILEPKTSYYSHCLYHALYCITPIQYIEKRLEEGFMPMGPVFYDPKKKSYYQALVKHTSKNIKQNQTVLPKLDEKERKCLRFLLQECSNDEIGIQLNCSPSAVEKIIFTLRKKFHVRKNIGLVREAVRHGFDDYLSLKNNTKYTKINKKPSIK
jgi:DNA-binding CsgD family transcriptional regulator